MQAGFIPRGRQAAPIRLPSFFNEIASTAPLFLTLGYHDGEVRSHHLLQGTRPRLARQQLDSLVYQALAEPADPNRKLYNRDAYRSGEVLPNPGRVRVTVSSENVHVEYIRSYLLKDATATHAKRTISATERGSAASGLRDPMPEDRQQPARLARNRLGVLRDLFDGHFLSRSRLLILVLLRFRH